MNGAAMDCRQDHRVLSLQREDSGSGYQIQINHPQEPTHSKATTHDSSDSFVVDGLSGHLHNRLSGTGSGDGKQRQVSGDPRSLSNLFWREPLDLPVPKFEIDTHYVGELPTTKSLDLDTRIDLLIKSKALAGMHPIFSELDESENSSFDSDDSFLENSDCKRNETGNRFSMKEEPPCYLSFDDPETPLSRPPSPFLSRATYLFWFNKAIELKQQAKAQEKALLELAAKKLLDNPLSVTSKPKQMENARLDKLLIDSLLDEISKELKEIVKEEFISNVLETSAFSALDNWWETQKQSGEERITVESTSDPEVFDEVRPSYSLSYEEKNESHGSSSPKVPYPWQDADVNYLEKVNKNNGKGNISDKEESCHLSSSPVSPSSENCHLNMNTCQHEFVSVGMSTEFVLKDEVCYADNNKEVAPDSTTECSSLDGSKMSNDYHITSSSQGESILTIEEKPEECVSSSVIESTSVEVNEETKLAENLPQIEPENREFMFRKGNSNDDSGCTSNQTHLRGSDLSPQKKAETTITKVNTREKETVKAVENSTLSMDNFNEERHADQSNESYFSLELPIIDTNGLMDKITIGNRRNRRELSECTEERNTLVNTEKSTLLSLETPTSPNKNVDFICELPEKCIVTIEENNAEIKQKNDI